MKQRGDDRLAARERPHRVHDRRAAQERAAVGLAGDRHDPAQRLHEHVEPGFLAKRPRRPECGERAVDDARVHGCAGVVADAEPLGHAAAIRFDHDVGALHELEKERLALRTREINGDAALVAIRGEVNRAVATRHRLRVVHAT